MPILGNGDIARVLHDRPDRLFFASGVSNSREERESEYQREVDLLLEQDRGMHIVYFSSLSVLYGVGRYLDHKREQEARVKAEFDRYTVVRIGNITWGSNPNTFINALRTKIASGEPFEVYDDYRYIVDAEELNYWVDRAPDWSCEMNIPGRRLKVQEAIDQYCYVGIQPKQGDIDERK